MNGPIEITADSPDDNFITNTTGQDVSIACNEMWGASQFSLHPGETKRMTFDVSAGAFPLGRYSYDDLPYQIGRGERWEVRSQEGQLVLVDLGAWDQEGADAASTTPEAPQEAANWYPDPSGRHAYRYWDGASWTSHVADNGQASLDPL